MDTFFVSGPLLDRASVEARVVRQAMLAYRHQVDPSLLEQWSREEVGRLWGDGVRVTTYVPMMALRRIRERLRADQRNRALRAAPVADAPTIVISDRGQTDHAPAIPDLISRTSLGRVAALG